jgi:hypothetical protein
MEVLREIRKVKNGEITIKVPDNFNETEVEILILPFNRDKDEKLENDITVPIQENGALVSNKPSFKEFLLNCPKMDEHFDLERQKDFPRSIQL